MLVGVAAASDTLKYREVADIVDEYLEARGLGSEDVQVKLDMSIRRQRAYDVPKLSQRSLRNKLLFAGLLGAVGYGVHEHGKKEEAEEKDKDAKDNDEKR